MAAWPSTLPAPEVSGYRLAPEDAVARTQMDAGPVRARRRYSTAPTLITVTWLFTGAQMQTFRDWFDDGANGADAGAAWFTIDLLLDTGLSTQTARFAAPWKALLLNATETWRVTAQLEVR